MTGQGFNDVIAGFREALRDYVKGDPEPAMIFFSDWHDVTLAGAAFLAFGAKLATDH